MSVRRYAVLAMLLAAVACAPERVVIVDDEVPLAEPLEASLGEGAPVLEQDDPPGRAIRLSLAEGAVARQPQGVDEWAPAVVNLPVGTGDSLWVPPGGRAELHAGATGLRLAPATGLEVLHMDDRSLQLGLPQGSVELRILPDRDVDSVEVDTPAGAVVLARAGTYRVDADPDGSGGRITVHSGQAEVTAGGVTVPVDRGSAMQLSGGDSPTYELVQAGQPDAFDQWCAGRESREDRSESALYVGRGVTGYEDMDGQGTWQVSPTYGSAWAPRVPVGWAPYREGRWAWSEPWGWTWVDDAPWGFATSHYGRWAYASNTWIWIPHADGMRMARPVYAPAVVAFAGGPGYRGSVSSGAGVAWFPLAPREPYLPAYPVSRAYVQGLNAGNFPPGAAIPGATAFHANQAVPGAMTVVPQSVFLGAGAVAPAMLTVKGPVRPQDVRVGSAPALVPGRASLLAALPGASPAAGPPASVPARELVVRTRLPLIPVPFEVRQQALAAAHGRPLGAPALGGLRPQGPGARSVPARLGTGAGAGGPLRPLQPVPRPAESRTARPGLGPEQGRNARQPRNPLQRNRERENGAGEGQGRLAPQGRGGPEGEAKPAARGRRNAPRRGAPGQGRERRDGGREGGGRRREAP